MKQIKILLLLIQRLWFHILMISTVLCMSPFLIVLITKVRYYPILWKVIRVWAHVIIYGMGFRISKKIDQVLEANKSYVFCSNHASQLDPFVLMILSKNPIVFVGKKELSKLPIFGFFYKRMVIMVNRSDVTSRSQVYKRAREKLKGGISIGIFPEGLVPSKDVILAPFKKGAFRLAIEHQIPIVPLTYYDCKRFFSWELFKGGMGTLRVRQHQFIATRGLDLTDLDATRQKTFQIIYEQLASDELYMRDTNRKNNRKIDA